MNELVSIITPCYNSEKFLDECISSVLNQTYQNWEMLIVDDNSSDNSSILIKSYSKKDERIKPLYLNDNIGAAMARNKAISKAKGKYLAFLDSDDVWLPKKLEVQTNFMKKNNCSFVFSSYSVISDDDKPKYTISVPETITYKKYLKNTIIGCLTVMLDKEKFKKIEMPNLRSSHDMALWLNLLKQEKYAYGIAQDLAIYREHKSSNTSNKVRAIYDVWNVYRKHEKLNLFYSIYNFVFYAINAFRKRL